MNIKITTLIEDSPGGQLIHEHGLSLYIEAGDTRILFDTGQSGDFIDNANSLNKSLEGLDYVIISHGHYDHSGGFERFLGSIRTFPKLIVGSEFFQPKYRKTKEGECHFNGNSFDENYLMKHQFPFQKMKEEVFCLTEDIMVFRHFSRSNDFEKKNDKFLVKRQNKYLPDDFDDEIALGIVTEQGLVVLVGCSHAGIVNILSSIMKKVKIPIYAVIGGTHLIEADENRIKNTIEAFRDMEIRMIAVSHCTGEKGIEALRVELPEAFVYNHTGNVIKI